MIPHFIWVGRIDHCPDVYGITEEGKAYAFNGTCWNFVVGGPL